MSIESEIAALTLATNNLLVAVNQKKAELDQRVIQATEAASQAAASAAAVATPSISLPAMAGEAHAGQAIAYSRGDHVHPTDTSRAAQSSLDELSNAFAQSKLTPVVSIAGSSHTLVPENAFSMLRFTGTGAKTITVSGAGGHTAGLLYSVTNRAASGDLTLTAADGMTLNQPKSGTLVLEPGDTVSLHCISSTVIDVLGSTKAAA